MTAKLGAAVIGLGVGEAHARAYARLETCGLRWLYDLNRDRAREVAESIGVGAVAGSEQAILDDPAVDVVSIASYDDAHYEQVMAALRATKHVFVEKPLCRSVEEARAIKRAWLGSGRHLASNLVLRAAPVYRWLREAVAGGQLGEVYAFDGDYLYGRLEKIMHGWRRHVADYSVMEGGGVHLIDLMLWLTGQKPASVAAAGNRISTSGSEFRYDDYLSATFQFPSTLVGRITANFGCVHPHQHVVRVYGTKGTFICDDQGPRLFESRDPATPPRRLELAALPASKGHLIPSFVDAIVSGADTRAATQHEFDVISTSVAAERAFATGGLVNIDYV